MGGPVVLFPRAFKRKLVRAARAERADHHHHHRLPDDIVVVAVIQLERGTQFDVRRRRRIC